MMYAQARRRGGPNETWSMPARAIQAKLTVGAAGDRCERDADRAADAVIGGAAVTVATRSAAVARRDPPAKPSAGGAYGEALSKLGEAFLKTSIGKQITDAAEKLGAEFIATLPGKVITGAVVAGSLAELAREHKGLPFQPPAVPLDFLAPGLKAQFHLDGPLDKPTGGSITFSIPLGASSAAPKAGTSAADYRAETERLRQSMSVGRPKDPDAAANDKMFEAYSRNQVVEASRRLIPTLKPLSTPLSPPQKDDTGAVHRKAADGSGGAFEAPASVVATTAESGQRLPHTVERDMSRRFGHDFSDVRVHADDRGAASAAAIGARAYTHGSHVVFGQGQYGPATREGRWLLAHELAHVVQQSGDRANHTDGGIAS